MLSYSVLRSPQRTNKEKSMREISARDITAAVAALCIKACCQLPEDIYCALERAATTEESPVGKDILHQLVQNADIARDENMPLCQDTGITVIFAEVGQDVRIVDGPFEQAIQDGVHKGYIDGFLRKSMVGDPLFERRNTRDNTPAIIHTRIVPGKSLRLRVGPKGAGSENKSILRMLIPADGMAGVRKVVLEAVLAAGPNSCPPLVVGVGLGGTMEQAAINAKRAAMRDLDSHNEDARYAILESELLDMVNRTGVGPQGLGGITTALAVHVEWSPTHIACLPVAVNINCHAARHAEIVL